MSGTTSPAVAAQHAIADAAQHSLKMQHRIAQAQHRLQFAHIALPKVIELVELQDMEVRSRAEVIAEQAFDIADAMLLELEGRPLPGVEDAG